MPGTKKVERGLVVFDDLPPMTERSRSGPKSVFEGLLDQIHADPQIHNKPISISRYDDAVGAKSARNVLRHRYGRSPKATGHVFEVRELEEADGSTKFHLFVIFQPGRITEGEMDKHVMDEKLRKEAREAKRNAARRDA